METNTKPLAIGAAVPAESQKPEAAGLPPKEAGRPKPAEAATSRPAVASAEAFQYKKILRTAVAKSDWDAFAESSPTAWFYHRYDYCSIWGAWPKRSDLSFALVEPNSSRLVATVPAFKLQDRMARLFAWNTIDVFGGIACAPQLPEKIRRSVLAAAGDELRQMAREHQAQEIRFSLAPMTPSVRGEACPRINPLLELGCANSMGCAWVADLRTSKDEHWKKIGKGARSSISKAQKSAVTTRIAQGDADLDRYYQIHCETYRRTGEAPQPREYFEGIWKHFVSTGLAVIFFAEQEGNTIAAANFAIYKKAAYYWTGASSAAGLSTGSNALLQWTAIQWMIAQGIEWYEVGPAFPYAREGKQKQISDFKKDFGGSLYPDFRGTLNTKNKIGKTLALAHDFYKQVLR